MHSKKREVSEKSKEDFVTLMMKRNGCMREEARSYLSVCDWDLRKAETMLLNGRRRENGEPEEMNSL